MNPILEAAVQLGMTIADLIAKAQAARAAGQAEQAAIIEKQLVDSTADFAQTYGGMPGALRANDTAADAAAAAKP